MRVGLRYGVAGVAAWNVDQNADCGGSSPIGREGSGLGITDFERPCMCVTSCEDRSVEIDQAFRCPGAPTSDTSVRCPRMVACREDTDGLSDYLDSLH